MLPRILAAHERTVPRPLAALPEPAPLAPDDAPPAEPARVRRVPLLAAAPPADHPAGPLIDVALGIIMTPIARVHAVAAREAEPPVALAVVRARPALREGGTRVQAELLRLLDRPGGWRGERAGADGEELDGRDLEGELAVAGAADVGGRVAADRDQPLALRGALCADGDEGRGQHVDDGAAREVDEAGAGGVGVDELLAELGGEAGGALAAARGLWGLVAQAGDLVGGLAAGALDAEVEDGDLEELDAVELDVGEGDGGAAFRGEAG